MLTIYGLVEYFRERDRASAADGVRGRLLVSRRRGAFVRGCGRYSRCSGFSLVGRLKGVNEFRR